MYARDLFLWIYADFKWILEEKKSVSWEYDIVYQAGSSGLIFYGVNLVTLAEVEEQIPALFLTLPPLCNPALISDKTCSHWQWFDTHALHILLVSKTREKASVSSIKSSRCRRLVTDKPSKLYRCLYLSSIYFIPINFALDQMSQIWFPPLQTSNVLQIKKGCR